LLLLPDDFLLEPHAARPTAASAAADRASIWVVLRDVNAMSSSLRRAAVPAAVRVMTHTRREPSLATPCGPVAVRIETVIELLHTGAVLEVSRRRFGELVDDAIDLLPEQLLRLLDNVVIQIEDRDVEQPGLLGVYRGVALTERGHDYSFQLPDTITIFRLPTLEICTDERQVATEVATTVVHEIGHYFGIDEQRLHELGWG
ncbi:MAG: hypothetical protein JWO57_2986, partial [Pseudonocardiales bacterium]|nr:hypothetical protein [Pseudonocardiales bacterium]